MGLSALLNLAVLALVGHFWPSLPTVTSTGPSQMILLTLVPPVTVVETPKPKPPPPKAIPPPPRPQPQVMATPLPPAPHQTPQIAPADAPTGGGGAPRPKPQPKPADRFHLLDPISPQADIAQAAKTTETDQPDDMDSGSGTMPAVTDPGPAKMKTPGKTDGATGTQDTGTKGSGQSGTGSGFGTGVGAGAGAGLFGTHGSGGGGSAPRHIVYVLDISGSMDMTEKKFGGKKRIEQAREELTAQFKTLGDGETFSLIAFSDEIRRFQPQLVKADTDTIRDAEKFLDGLTPDGDTDLEGALKAALAMPGVNVVVVITDGVPHTQEFQYSTPDDFFKLATRIAAADPAHVPIYAYGLLGPNPDGTDDSQEASVFLTQIAADSGGKFVEVKLAGEGR